MALRAALACDPGSARVGRELARMVSEVLTVVSECSLERALVCRAFPATPLATSRPMPWPIKQ